MTESLEEMCLRRWWESCIRSLLVLPNCKRWQRLAARAQKDFLIYSVTRCLLALTLLGSLAFADVENSVDDLTRAIKERDRHERIIEAAGPEVITQVINEAGEGCRWVPVFEGDHPKRMKTQDGYHAVYLKVCDDDQK